MRATAGPLLLAFSAGLTALLAQPAQAAGPGGSDGALIQDDKIHAPTPETLEQAGNALGTSLDSIAPGKR